MTAALLDRGASVNSAGEGTGETALFQAAKRGHDKIVRMLAARGADINLVARSMFSWGEAAIHVAAMKGHDDVIRTLDLKPHPEGGWYIQTHRIPDPHDHGHRSPGTAIYYLLGEGERSHWHKVDAT
jgi:hypothetical protein